MSRDQLLAVLSDGAFHSGEQLGLRLGVSRAAIWKQLKGLQELGVSVESIKGRGYRIVGGLSLLDKGSIIERLSKPGFGNVHIQVEKQVSSTNILCREIVERDVNRQNGCVVLAEAQLSGKGRRGKSWVSPFGQNIYLSVSWSFESGVSAVQGLSLAVGIAVATMLEKNGITDVKLKWPNDLLWHDKKIGGVLIELIGDPLGHCQVVVGVGVNVNMTKLESREIDQPWVSMASILKHPLDRNKVAADLIANILSLLASYEEKCFAWYESQWQELDVLRDKPVRIFLGARVLDGVAKGVNETGELLVDLGGTIQAFSGGEVSVRELV